jgi:integrase
LLRTFYDQTYRPTIAHLEASRRRQYDGAVKAAIAFEGDGLTIDRVNRLFLDELRRELTAKEVSETSVDRMLACLLRIARTWNPVAVPGMPLCGMKYRWPTEAAPRGSLREYAEQVYIPQTLIGCTHGTVVNILKAINSFYDHYGVQVLLSQLNDALLADHLAWIHGRGIKPATVNNGYRATICCVWRHAFKNGLVSNEPSVKKLREERHEPDAWSPEEIAAMITAAGDFQPGRDYSGVPRNLLWQTLILTAWYTGLRRGGLLGILFSDLELSSGVLVVPASRMKNRRGKSFRLGPDAIAAIGRISSPRRRLVFPIDVCPNNFYRHFDQILAAAGIPTSRRKGHNKFHKLRRSTATAVALTAGEATAAALLGHSNTVVTQRYIDPTKMPGNDAAAILPSLRLSG